ncbi:MAG: LapA family protein [Acidimicrobiales bacterium]
MADDDRRWVGSGGDDEGAGKPGITPKQITAGVLAVLLVVFVLQNTDSTSITLLLFDVTFPLWLVLTGTILISVGIGYLIGSRRRKR